jgi:hypothetical protein
MARSPNHPKRRRRPSRSKAKQRPKAKLDDRADPSSRAVPRRAPQADEHPLGPVLPSLPTGGHPQGPMEAPSHAEGAAGSTMAFGRPGQGGIKFKPDIEPAFGFIQSDVWPRVRAIDGRLPEAFIHRAPPVRKSTVLLVEGINELTGRPVRIYIRPDDSLVACETLGQLDRARR